MLKGTINFAGATLGDVVLALEEAVERIAEGNIIGKDENEDGRFSFAVEGEEEKAAPVELLFKGSLITYTDEGGVEHCLGNLLVHEGLVFDPELGRVDVTREEAEAHNRLFDAALVEGLDAACEVGQGGHFYLTGDKVATWTGTVVAERVTFKGRRFTFERKGRTFGGEKPEGDNQCVFVERLA